MGSISMNLFLAFQVMLQLRETPLSNSRFNASVAIPEEDKTSFPMDLITKSLGSAHPPVRDLVSLLGKFLNLEAAELLN